ncbi:unnamed protein product [Owenia fusiformis]|uniref:Uncharacterized protein n=1 Tax=Owenia fusiformis TaxID=6347 RepID=A0A8S4Q3I6_OWEFU|nr:unnamed protein product [Owenia fusiformis]
MKVAIAVCLVAVLYLAEASRINELEKLKDDSELAEMRMLLKRYMELHQKRNGGSSPSCPEMTLETEYLANPNDEKSYYECVPSYTMKEETCNQSWGEKKFNPMNGMCEDVPSWK